MSALVDLSDATVLWRCDACGVESAPRPAPRLPDNRPVPVGWAWDDACWGRHHFCPECRINAGMEPGYNAGCNAVPPELPEGLA